MARIEKDMIAVIFRSTRNADDSAGYAEAAAQMARRAALQPGYVGVESVREPGGAGITISYWADEASALAWRDDAEHRRIREAGRARWYDDYSVVVARVERSYDWAR